MTHFAIRGTEYGAIVQVTGMPKPWVDRIIELEADRDKFDQYLKVPEWVAGEVKLEGLVPESFTFIPGENMLVVEFGDGKPWWARPSGFEEWCSENHDNLWAEFHETGAVYEEGVDGFEDWVERKYDNLR